MNNMRRRLMILLTLILLFCQLFSVLWLWHESQEQISFLVDETLSARARNLQVETEISEAIAALLVPSLVMVGFTLLFSFWAIRWITRPLNELCKNLTSRSAENLTPLPVFSDMEEVTAVTSSLNQLLSRLDFTIQRERMFTADAAHELRTPLAGIRLHLELMSQAGNSQATPLITRIDQLTHTVEQLLMLARAGQNLVSGHHDTINWSTHIITPLMPELTEMAVQRQQRIVWDSSTRLSIQGDATLLRLMLRNLVENAIRYSPPKTLIQITLQAQDKGTEIAILDEGPGIADAYRQSITDPFQRIDKRYGGSGLGLNIVQRIVLLHQGKLRLENRPEGGLAAYCWLPTTRE